MNAPRLSATLRKSAKWLVLVVIVAAVLYRVKFAAVPVEAFEVQPGVVIGEVMGTGRTFGEAYAKAQLASGVKLPRRGVCLISVRDRDKPNAVELARRLVARGFEIVATDRTAQAIIEGGVACRRANKVREGRPHIVDMIKNDEISLIVNTTEGKTAIFESFPFPVATARSSTSFTKSRNDRWVWA